MMAEFQALVTSLNTALNIAKAAKSVDDFNNFATAVADVNMKYLAATNAAAQQATRIAELEAELRRLKEQKTDADRYRLHTFPTGNHAYALKDPPRGDEREHYLCPTCFDRGNRSVLQPTGPQREFLKCNACGASIQIKSVQSLRYPPTGIV